MKAPDAILEPRRIRPKEVAERLGAPPWDEALLDDGRNWAVLTCDPPGRRTGPHVHLHFNEWWVVVSGEVRWQLGTHPPIHARPGDIVPCPAGTPHSTETLSDRPSLRLSVSKPGASAQAAEGLRQGPSPLSAERAPQHASYETGRDARTVGDPMWTEPVVLDDRNKAGFIHYGPGMESNPPWHPGFDEWWIVLKGELVWQVGSDRPPIEARQWDIVFVPGGMRHGITSIGDDTSVRLAVTPPDAPHIYTDEDASAPPPRE